jgi:hypothetical protein
MWPSNLIPHSSITAPLNRCFISCYIELSINEIGDRMDWRFIAAISAAAGSFCFVAVGAYVVLSSPPAPQRTAAPTPLLVSEYRFPAASPPPPLNGQLSSSSPISSIPPPPSPFAPQSAPGLMTSSASATTGTPAQMVTSSFAPSLEPPRVIENFNSPPIRRSESRPEPRTAGQKTAALTPADSGTRQDPLPRPVVEARKGSVVPELHTALPATRYRGILTSAEIARIKHNLRLTLDQEPAWPPVEAALAEMGRQQIALLRQGQEPRISQSDWPAGRIYAAAGPLLQALRPDQKETVRRLCRSLGFEGIASMI